MAEIFIFYFTVIALLELWWIYEINNFKHSNTELPLIITKMNGGGWLIFNFASPFCFLFIEFHFIFSISYKTLQYYVYYYFILIR